MINRKCSRCKEITGTMHGGKKLRKNFYVKTVCKKELRAGKSNYHKWNKKNLVSFYKDIKITSVIYLIVSIITAFSAGAFIQDPGLGGISFSITGTVGVMIIGSIFQSVLVFCGIWVFILLVETVIKIYEKMK